MNLVGLSCRSAEERMNMAVRQSAIAISSSAAQQHRPTTKVHGPNACAKAKGGSP
jgi:hypothetical protein